MVKKKKVFVKIIEEFDNLKVGEIIEVSKSDAFELQSDGMVEIINYNPETNKIEKEKSGREKHLELEEEKEARKIRIPDEEETRVELCKCYGMIKEVIKEYSDLDEKYLPILASWIIGTYIHDSFESYPYLFINAMKGSGKTRLLKLVAKLSKKGEVTNNLSEAVLFRNTKGSTLCIDEFEGVGKKEASTLREILNSSYKKGAKIKRMKKKKTPEGEDYVVEEFDIYFPIAMANIWGMEEVLGDRCISIILEKSHRPEIVKLVENYDDHEKITTLKSAFLRLECSLCSVVSKKNINILWNNYIQEKYKTTLTTPTSFNTYIDNNYIKYIHFFNKIDESNISGRNLELSFPLFIINQFLGEEYVDEIIKVLKYIVQEREDEERVEGRDVTFLRFLSGLTFKEYVSIKKITGLFKLFVGEEDLVEKWVSSKWIGRALRRLNLVEDKRRTSLGIEVLINFNKAKEKFKHYE